MYDYFSEQLREIENMLKAVEERVSRYVMNSQVRSQPIGDDYVLPHPATSLYQARLRPQLNSGGTHNARRLGKKAPDPKGVGFMSRI